MPPSGFNDRAIHGLLLFVRANYQSIALKSRGSSLSEQDFLKQTAVDLEEQVKISLADNFPNSSTLKEGIQGLVIFIVECYRDLAKEISVGKDKQQRVVLDGKAIQKELDQLEKYLQQFEL